jgi:site-specific DNA recombinase
MERAVETITITQPIMGMSVAVRAALYARVSSAEQAQGHSIDVQLEKLHQHAALHGYHVADEYVDPGFTGANGDRPEFQRLLKDAENGLFDVVLVLKIDRFFRSTLQLLKTLEQLTKQNIGFVSASEPFDTSTPVGRFMLTSLGSIAELERSMISERTDSGKVKAAQTGKWMGGSAPYGFQIDPATKKLAINEDEAKVVRMVHRWLVEEQMSLHQIQQRLNRMKVPTRYDTEGKVKSQNSTGWWASGTVYRLLTKSIYEGYRMWRKIRIPCPRIVTEELWEAGRKQLVRNHVNAPRRAKRSYLLKGLMRCGICGRLYVGKFVKNHVYYTCASRFRENTPEPCGNRPLPGRVVEPLIWELLTEYLQDPQLILQQFREQRSEEMADTLQRELEYVEAGLKTLADQERRLYDGITAGLISLDYAAATKPKLQSEQERLSSHKREIEAQLAQIEPRDVEGEQLEAFCARMRQGLEALDEAGRQKLVSLLVDKIVVTPEGLEVNVVFALGEHETGVMVKKEYALV